MTPTTVLVTCSPHHPTLPLLAHLVSHPGRPEAGATSPPRDATSAATPCTRKPAARKA